MDGKAVTDFGKTIILGASGLSVRKMGIGSDAGISSKALEWAFGMGVNYFYWGSRRRSGMRAAIRTLAPRYRENMVIALQTYDYTGLALDKTLARGLKQLKIDYADVFILGMRNKPVPDRILEKALAIKEKGMVRHLCVSAHDRSAYQHHLKKHAFDIIMVRYNAAHRGAEKEIFPLLESAGNPGVICYNSTRWGNLFNPKWMPKGINPPSPMDLYRYVLSNPAVHLVLTAPETEEQLKKNLRVLESGPVTEDERRWLEKIGDHVHRQNPSTNFDFLFNAFQKLGKLDKRIKNDNFP
jgi:predicted aldo/keto reductase-like oxidoreductase